MIDLLESEEQLQIVETLRRFLSAELPVARLRSSGTETDHAAWGRLAELGMLGVGAPEAAGGLGLGLAEEALAFRELGRVAATPSFLASWLALRIALHGGDDALAGDLVSGAARACFAVPSRDGGWLLVDAPGAGHAVSLAGDTARLMRLASGAGEPVAALDWTLPVEKMRADALPLSHAISDEAVLWRFDVVQGAMLAGLAEGARDLAVAYAGMREQFGQPIGAFQAIKHKCADMEVRCTAAWAQVVFAALSVEAGDPGGSYNRLAARILAKDAAIANAEEGIQIHGGIGFTAQCDAHAFLKRARAVSGFGAAAGNPLARFLALDAPQPEMPAAAVA